jgi:hypothetical protein
LFDLSYEILQYEPSTHSKVEHASLDLLSSHRKRDRSRLSVARQSCHIFSLPDPIKWGPWT